MPSFPVFSRKFCSPSCNLSKPICDEDLVSSDEQARTDKEADITSLSN